MPIEWKLILQVILKLLQVLATLPPEADHREASAGLADALLIACGLPKK